MADQKPSATKSSFRITKPRKDYVTEKYVEVSGVGAPPGSAIILATSLFSQYLSLQKDSVIADQNGNWRHPRCHLGNPEKDRLVYALAIDPRYETKVRELGQDFKVPTDKAMDKFAEVLKGEGIEFQVSPGKWLIRRQKKKISEAANRDEPPKMISTIVWFAKKENWKKYWWAILAAFVILVVGSAKVSWLWQLATKIVATDTPSSTTPKPVTISGGEIRVSGQGTYLVETESRAASDVLTKISGLSEGQKVILKAAHGDRTVVIKAGPYLKMQGPVFSLNNQDDKIGFTSKGSDICSEDYRTNVGD